MSVMLSIFHVKDTKNYLHLATDPHLKICCFWELKTFTLKDYVFKVLRNIFMIFQK